MFEKLHRLSPEGKADYKLRQFLEDKKQDRDLTDYDNAWEKYRKFKSVQLVLKILLYASIITSVAASFNFNLKFISMLASFLGPTLLLILYAVTTYFSRVYKEEFYLERELLLLDQK